MAPGLTLGQCDVVRAHEVSGGNLEGARVDALEGAAMRAGHPGHSIAGHLWTCTGRQEGWKKGTRTRSSSRFGTVAVASLRCTVAVANCRGGNLKLLWCGVATQHKAVSAEATAEFDQSLEKLSCLALCMHACTSRPCAVFFLQAANDLPGIHAVPQTLTSMDTPLPSRFTVSVPS